MPLADRMRGLQGMAEEVEGAVGVGGCQRCFWTCDITMHQVQLQKGQIPCKQLLQFFFYYIKNLVKKHPNIISF